MFVDAAVVRSNREKVARALGTHTKAEWRALLDEFDYRCVKCGRGGHLPRLANHGLTKDHIVPISEGGSDAIENIQPLCKPCNSSKGTGHINYAAYRRRNWHPTEAWG